MAKESMKARERKRQKLVDKYAKKRKELKEQGDYVGLSKLLNFSNLLFHFVITFIPSLGSHEMIHIKYRTIP